MTYFKKRENVNLYKKMMEGYDNSYVINQVRNYLSANSTILELGMGTGIDLISLSKNYRVLGSDYSKNFVDDFKEISNLNVCVLDAINIDINSKFDCIYSNKVLQHLSKEDFIYSLNSQYKHLNENGIIFMTLWHGPYNEEFEFDNELRFVYYDKQNLEKIVPNNYKFIDISYYTEFEDNDSIIVVLKK